MRRNDHFVPRPNIPRAENELQSIKPVTYRDAVLRLAISSKLALQRFRLLPKKHPPRIHHPVISSIKLILQLEITRLDIKKWNFHLVLFFGRRAEGLISDLRPLTSVMRYQLLRLRDFHFLPFTFLPATASALCTPRLRIPEELLIVPVIVRRIKQL